MPIYAYKCSSCQHERDVLQKVSDPALTVCPQCGAATFAKQLTAAGFQLKGSGWYATDFKNRPAPEAKAPAKPDEAKPEKGAAAPAKEPPASKEAASATASSRAAVD